MIDSKGKVKIFLLVCFVFLIIPDTTLSWYIPSSGILRFVVLPILWFLTFYYSPLKKAVRSKKGPNSFWLFAFIAIGILSSVFSEAPVLSFIKLSLFLGLVIPLFTHKGAISSSWIHNHSNFVYNGILLVFIILSNPIKPFFSNPNQVGILSTIALGIWLYKISSFRLKATWKGLFLSGVMTLYILLVVWQAGSRTGLASTLTVLLCWITLRNAKSLISTLGSTFLVFSLSIFLIVILGVNDREEVRGFIEKGSDTTLLDSVRKNMIDESLVYFNERPLLGYGFGLSWNVQAKDLKTVLTTGRMSALVGEFGNSVLAILIGGGLFLLIAYYGLIFALFFRSLFLLYRLPPRDPRRRLLLMSLSLVAGLFINSQGEGWMISLGWPTFILWMALGQMNHLLGVSVQTPLGNNRRKMSPLGPRLRRVTEKAV